MIHKGISTKKTNAIIIYTETSVDNNGFWNIKETYFKGYTTNKSIKDPFLLDINMMTNIRKTEMHSIVDLNNMRTVYNKTIRYYEFGTIEDIFDIRNKIEYTNASGYFFIFSMYGIYQIARSFPFGITNQMNIIIPILEKDNKFKISIMDNNINKIKINKEEKYCYEMEVKIEGMPFAMLFPKMKAYIETNDNTRKIVKYNSISGMFDVMEIYLISTNKNDI